MTDEIPPSRSSAPPSPPELDARLNRVLRLFTRLSLICLAAGLAAALVWPGALAPRVLLHAGVSLLLASPGSRLVVIVAVHAHKRQWSIVVMAVITLAIMLSSLAAGLLVH